ncbi:hypothetical protein TSUD_348590 [Trifolium subterraneum]|uniref:Uncharacterized protein n=1 Tax=Trifolium subterraneum TaxID=3900 RepID=A0A2Z6NW89_TRISU|nr:hypothetical protein TSUD_348590 [Trifolium subterraneum]
MIPIPEGDLPRPAEEVALIRVEAEMEGGSATSLVVPTCSQIRHLVGALLGTREKGVDAKRSSLGTITIESN